MLAAGSPVTTVFVTLAPVRSVWWYASRFLRAWVSSTGPALGGDAVGARPRQPTDQDQLARTYFVLGWWLAQQGRTAEAEPHLARAGELAPHDFTIRRGSMRIRGKDPAGPEFFAMVTDWTASGHDYYVPLPDLAPER